MMFDIFATGQAARMLVQRDPAPGDRLDAFLFLAGQEYLWRTDGPGPDFGEAVCIYEIATGKTLPKPASLPVFGVVKHRRAEPRREVAVWFAGRFIDWIYSRDRGRRCDKIWRLGDGLLIGLGLSHEAACKELSRSLDDAEHRVTELALANVADPGIADSTGNAAP